MNNYGMQLLKLYGLDQLLTHEDDPLLWINVVRKYWPTYDELIQKMPRIVFGIRNENKDSDKHDNLYPKEIVIPEVWRIEYTDGKSLKLVSITLKESVQMYPEYILHVSRPSANKDTAIIHLGENPAPLIGRGESRVWKRRDEGVWVETDDVFDMWLS